MLGIKHPRGQIKALNPVVTSLSAEAETGHRGIFLKHSLRKRGQRVAVQEQSFQMQKLVEDAQRQLSQLVVTEIEVLQVCKVCKIVNFKGCELIIIQMEPLQMSRIFEQSRQISNAAVRQL